MSVHKFVAGSLIQKNVLDHLFIFRFSSIDGEAYEVNGQFLPHQFGSIALKIEQNLHQFCMLRYRSM
ncbi:hypothetical protein ACQ0P8_09610 [Halodesulfovibrio aestuarii]|uniref:Uncharacterized protein n=1 Tax=Halodesulfovibrio aestuarii TaxID=126333 RepID=A0A8G2FHK9_9BACT|nr:hypothetical protein [Halodesulfovibrio aestuarii]SHJ01549.1 hypothetical protein SAMN05660830_01365 [Halodesulfovibrio aestuarii]